MPESPPPPLPASPAGDASKALTPEAVEAILADFRTWLHQIAAAAPPVRPPPEEAAPIDLHTLLGQFVALRHEVNLQTKAVRGQQELNTETLHQLSQAMDFLRQAHATASQANEQAEDERLRPLLKTLVDLYDALALAGRQVQRVQEAILPALDQVLAGLEPAPEAVRSPAAPQAPQPPPSFFARWFGRGPAEWQPLQAQQQAREAAERVRQLLDSVVTGYTMSVQRLERALQQQGLEPIPALGQAFDPERMEVVEVIRNSNQPPNQVVDEVRRGYLWRGRVFRYAQVGVAKPSGPG